MLRTMSTANTNWQWPMIIVVISGVLSPLLLDAFEPTTVNTVAANTNSNTFEKEIQSIRQELSKLKQSAETTNNLVIITDKLDKKIKALVERQKLTIQSHELESDKMQAKLKANVPQ